MLRRSPRQTIASPLKPVSLWGVTRGLLICSLGTAYEDSQRAWSDEVDGTFFKPHNWTFDIGNHSGSWDNSELEYHASRPQNVYLTNGLLQSAANVAGPWSDSGDATSPLAVTPNEARGFYQIKLQ